MSGRAFHHSRRAFVGGSDARLGSNEEALLGLWREMRGEAGPPDYSDNLVIQLGVATEPQSALVRANDGRGHQAFHLKSTRR